MLTRRTLWPWFLVAILAVGVAFLMLPAYEKYCQADHTKNYYCAAYKLAMVFGDFIDAHNGAINALATFAIALFTLTLWRSSEKMWNATQDALRHAERTAERELRAYVHISGGEIKFEPLNAPTWHLTVKNFGKTPAYDVRQWTHMWIEEYPLKVKLPAPDADFKTACSILPPGGHEEMVCRRDPPIPGEALNLIGTVKGTVYIYGEIRYRDAFGEDRVTKYRLLYGGPTPNRGGFLKPDSEGNEAT